VYGKIVLANALKRVLSEASQVSIKRIHGMKNARKYQRYALSHSENTPDQFEVMVDGKLVSLVNFSVGGMSILSDIPFTPGRIHISVNSRNRGEIDLIGTIIRKNKEGDMWHIALNLSKIYNLNALKAL
jgi:hypothetical protein